MFGWERGWRGFVWVKDILGVYEDNGTHGLNGHGSARQWSFEKIPAQLRGKG